MTKTLWTDESETMTLCYALLCGTIALVAGEGAGLGNGFGNHVSWLPTLDAGITAAQAERKPLMVIVHKSWCGACKALAPKFAGSDEIAELSDDFVMVNLIDDDEPSDESYKPDGGYIPRILFVDPATGAVDASLINAEGNPQYKYFYTSAEQVESGMKAALAKLGGDKSEL